jgi:hypothetical protein
MLEVRGNHKERVGKHKKIKDKGIALVQECNLP